MYFFNQLAQSMFRVVMPRLRGESNTHYGPPPVWKQCKPLMPEGTVYSGKDDTDYTNGPVVKLGYLANEVPGRSPGVGTTQPIHHSLIIGTECDRVKNQACNFCTLQRLG